ncbi:hypothetical protein [Lysinibacillus sp. NPDC047702]|uniref:hypothetical protein n=1 Tax=unclassified Lysinibacillus TaxID=2636778 RepID=UPI003D00259F
MNRLEQTTQELLEAGYTIEEIKAAFKEVIEQAKQVNTEPKSPRGVDKSTNTHLCKQQAFKKIKHLKETEKIY